MECLLVAFLVTKSAMALLVEYWAFAGTAPPGTLMAHLPPTWADLLPPLILCQRTTTLRELYNIYAIQNPGLEASLLLDVLHPP